MRAVQGDSFTLGLLLFPGQNATALNEWINNINTAATASNPGVRFRGYCSENITQLLVSTALTEQTLMLQHVKLRK